MDVFKWSAEAKPGDKLIYHVRHNSWAQPSSFETAHRAHAAGLVFLAQKRLTGGCIAFEATRVSPRTAQLLGLLPERGVPQASRFPQLVGGGW